MNADEHPVYDPVTKTITLSFDVYVALLKRWSDAVEELADLKDECAFWGVKGWETPPSEDEEE